MTKIVKINKLKCSTPPICRRERFDDPDQPREGDKKSTFKFLLADILKLECTQMHIFVEVSRTHQLF